MSGRTRVVAAGTTALACAVIAAPAQAKTHTTSVSSKTTLNGTTVTGSFSGSFGRGRVKGTADLPYFYLTYYASGGSLTMRFKGAPTSTGTVTGTYVWMKGTGRYKRIRGSGHGTGTPFGKGYKSFSFKFTGTARY
jgi:hypothetical protein